MKELTPDQQTAEELYKMVQELKLLLSKWTRTSYLNKAQKLELRRETRKALRNSSTRIIHDM